MQTIGRCHQSGRYKAVVWLLLLLLWWWLCPVVLAAKKNVECLPVGVTASSEYGAFLKTARFAPSLEQQKELESLFTQMKERHITIKPRCTNCWPWQTANSWLPLARLATIVWP